MNKVFFDFIYYKHTKNASNDTNKAICYGMVLWWVIGFRVSLVFFKKTKIIFLNKNCNTCFTISHQILTNFPLRLCYSSLVIFVADIHNYQEKQSAHNGIFF